MHDPANSLYDCACEVLDAAQRLRGAACRTGSEEALAPVLGCVAESLRELARAQQSVGMRLRDSSPREGSAAAAVGRALGGLEGRLVEAERACAAARDAVGGLRC
jgi:hypothetical protein